MSFDLKTKLAEAIRTSLGENATPEQVVELLYKGGSITDDTILQHIIGREFWRRYQEMKRPVAYAVEMAIAEEFGITQRKVHYWRCHHHRGGTRGSRRPAKK